MGIANYPTTKLSHYPIRASLLRESFAAAGELIRHNHFRGQQQDPNEQEIPPHTLPTLGLFGPSDEQLYGPWGPDTRVARGPRSYKQTRAVDPSFGSSVDPRFVKGQTETPCKFAGKLKVRVGFCPA